MQALKRFVVGTPLEPFARFAHYCITRNKDYAYNQQTFKIMRRVLASESCFVDVGCNEGAMLEKAIRLAPLGEHWGFEPIPHLYATLKERFPKAHLVNAALSDSAGELPFHIVLGSEGLSGFSVIEHEADRPTQQTAVPTLRMDDVIPQQARIDLLKIDVNGAELLVFRGAQETIARTKPVIIFEHGLGGATSYGHKPEQVFDLLTDSGLKITTMHGYLNRSVPFSRQQFADWFYQGKDFQFCAY